MSRFVLNGRRAAGRTRQLWPSGTSPRTRSSSRAPASGGSSSRSGRWSSRWPSLCFENWTLITNLLQTYPSSVQNLNRLTMTVDVDIYDEESQKVEIPAMPGDSPIKVIIYPCLSDCWQVETMRMKRKDYDGILRMPEPHTVRVAERLKLIKVRFFRFCFLFL